MARRKRPLTDVRGSAGGLSEPRTSVSGGSSNELRASLTRSLPRPTSPGGRGDALTRILFGVDARYVNSKTRFYNLFTNIEE